VTGSTLLAAALAGERRALARVISQIEENPDSYAPAGPRRAPVVGITGPPGVGKSTLVNGLIAELRARDHSVAVLAVDPSSPITGGALLGDRIRMQGHVDDRAVYVRSMSARGHLGGLAVASQPVVELLARGGFDYVLVETVGVGQSEVEIMGVADHVVLVVAPGWGDQIQADKAGIVEIADIFVINKADRPGLEEVQRALHDIGHEGEERPVLVTTATDGTGLPELLDAIDRLAAS
jgi:LAO/AO transport system kinase